MFVTNSEALTGCKKWRLWDKAREKYMPVKRRQTLAETERGNS